MDQELDPEETRTTSRLLARVPSIASQRPGHAGPAAPPLARPPVGLKSGARVAAGATLGGQYTVVRMLGSGAMGQVFEVMQESLGCRRALKLLTAAPTPKQEKRFVREARALARVQSPRVAQVSDFGVEPGLGPFYVMEFVDGETLAERLARTRTLPWRVTVALGVELLEALADVHDLGIVHRDVKPSNIALPRIGPVGVKLIDFGLAVDPDDSVIGRVTTSRTIIGSMAYIAPEIILDEPPSPASDLYAAGIVLYETLTGELPFTGRSAAECIRRCLSMPVPPLAPELDVPPAIEAFVRRLLEKPPEQRFESARSAAAALRTLELA
jgi:eukaryotic-like serine/threonine-protein kinase